VPPFSALLLVCWGVFVAAWAVGAVYNARWAPRTLIGDSRFGFLPRWVVTALAILVAEVVLPRRLWAPLTYSNFDVAVVGAALLLPSTVLALWARWTLGRMWSSVPSLRERHELRTDGPYRLTRHPIYTGILGMLLGTAMIVGFGAALVALVVFAGVFIYRIPREERLMTDTFGDQYRRYQRDVPRLVPFVHI
jgi:protein-S-isoprenylcysteine O-methyltransferase Ste14